MSSLKIVNLVERQCRRLVNVSYTQRKIHLTIIGNGKSLKGTSCVFRKRPLTEWKHKSSRTFSTELDASEDRTLKDLPLKKEGGILSSEEIENVLSSGNITKLSSDKELENQRKGTVGIPDDLTEEEFLEVATAGDRIKYAKTRLANLSPMEEKRLKVLKLLYDVLLSTGARCPQPEYLTDGHWLFLLLCRKTEVNVKRQLALWLRMEKAEANIKEKKLAKLEKIKQEEDSSENYADMHNKIVRRISNTMMNVHYFNNLAYSMKFGQPIIYDFSFAEDMKVRELQGTIQQFKHCHAVNKVLSDPFHMHICGFPTGGKFFHILKKKMDDILRPDVPITYTTKDINELDLVPREKLVYLSPNSPHVLTKFNHDDVYVIGGVVDLGSELPLTYAKAKRLNIRSVRLPLDRYVTFQGGKALTLNQVTAILTDLKLGLSMKEAVLKHIPRRKVLNVIETDRENFSFVEHRCYH